jgi:ketosteroid isomerase-like protein
VPRENVELVKAMLAAWLSRDWEAATAAWDPALEWHSAEDEPDAGTYRGIEAVVAMLQGWDDAFDDFHASPLDFIAVGESVVVPYKVRGRLRGSSSEVEVAETQVYKLREGKIIEVREYRTREQALKAVGLSK